MFNITVHVPSSIYGQLTVQAEVERGHYTIGPVRDAYGRMVPCTLDLLEEIETSIEFELQCARYEALFFDGEDPALIALYS